MNDGDWICSDSNCGNINFARRLTCYRCNKEKPNGAKPSSKKLGTEIGKSAAEKSRGLFNADDWQCNKCANVNWARRQTCNVCNAPKFGEVEARTGYGGGYNERGVVEYRRRESSSSDEYDEFGRKKRKRKADDDKVGITEGPENKKLPPTMLQRETKMGPFLPVPAPNITLQNKKETEKVNGSLSDGSVCELPRVNKMAFRRNQMNYKHDHSIPSYKANGVQRKRFTSTGDKDPAGSSGYETGSKKGKNDSPNTKVYNPVMENRVSSTNNDVVYKFTGPTPAEDFEVTYTVEERVRAAAFAIVYNNCKISTDKFECLYDKPAPDFKTIFAWRQRLLSTGCLVDLHLETQRKEADKPQTPKTIRKKVIQKLPNPDEIAIISDSDDDCLENSEVSQPAFPLRQKSISAETLLLPGADNDSRRTCGSVSTLDGRGSQGRSHSESTHRRTRSSSCDSQESNYPNSDLEPSNKNFTKGKAMPLKSTRQSLPNSDSESLSYNSDEVDFRSRVFGDMTKVRRKQKKHSISAVQANYIPNEASPFQGYSTVKPLEQSPLATGFIYTSNFHNMNVNQKGPDNISIDTDAYSSEYVPTKLGATAKKNYQDFKNNVKKKGFWAKGAKKTFPKQQSCTNMQEKQLTNNYLPEAPAFVTAQPPVLLSKMEDFTKDEFESCVSVDQYLPFDKPLEPTLRNIPTPENTSRIFDVVQSNSVSKNKSIMDIFDSNEQNQECPDKINDLENLESARKKYETEWDEDDDALYKNSDTLDIPLPSKRVSSPHNDIGAKSPMTNMVYATSQDSPKNNKTSQLNVDIKDKRDMLFGLLLKDNHEKPCNISHQNGNIIIEGQNQLHENISQSAPQSHIPIKALNFNHIPTPIPFALSDEIMCISEEIKNTTPNKSSKTISPSKKVHVLESITFKSNNHPEQPNISRRMEQQPIQNNINITPKDSPKGNTPRIPTPMQNLGLSPSSPSTKSRDTPQKQITSEIDLSNLLSNINTDTLLLALQNLQQLSQTGTLKEAVSSQNDEESLNQNVTVETINLTNDEEWEKESNQDESIERELEKLDGNTGDTPFLSDIFDPGPVVMPSNMVNKLNLNLKKDEAKSQTNLNENAPVIGNFKSFALPKPIMLNRLKLSVKQTEKNASKTDGKRVKRRKKKQTTSKEDGDGADEEESGDEADLSKYDLWGSDEEQGNSSKMDNENHKEDENSKDNSVNALDKNGKPETKSKKRLRSSSSSSTSSSSSSSSHSSSQAPKNRFDDFNLNSERESQPESPRGHKSRTRSRSPRVKRRLKDPRSAGERNYEKEKSRERDRRERSRGSREKKERRYSRDGPAHYGVRGRHR